MIKRMIILIVMGLTLSSCDFIHYGKIAIQDNVRRIEMERERKEARKKDAYAAAGNPEYEAGVELAIQDIMKRPVNKRVEFEGLTLLIPENTRLNLKHGNVVDEKTGYGIPILFERDDYCTKVFYSKKVRNNLYILIEYNDMDKDLDVIGQKIIKANGFSKNCK
ncbi:hypothetical protein [Fusobacterium pseudoperiodonticum]|uniref:Lipoprotein n=1 Tax=Fusobacterium pseudoperiodonticum TaxID=2663009 RepID=A0A2D3PNK7_9FUSO|nr:hypothetical protein [Fusobacterium pseudoperiodonticum]ATV69258.1 hypothetical protein CTM98_00280 [Fusobacterium pseudoperiodonticum]